MAGEFWLVKGEDGKLRGVSEKDQKRYQKMRLLLNELEVGEAVRMGGLKLPRSRRHFGFFFCKLRELFDRQERFAEQDRMLDWLLVGAGYCDLVPGLGGQVVAMPKSISWEECDEQTFIEVHRKIDEFLWTDYAQEFLWPHLRPDVRAENVEGWHAKAEENRQTAVARLHAEGRL